ncbi:RESA-H3 antigen, putative [Perkinsus marinus ATCC 50983]|uniref:RESA-H3 antigen, putative n=1 Tax=Perkinsus marinus (strain ATCC 50983 / TXsc) TaxID=423536 RepID=C5KFA5_PERM5|nr:RESA-H3 antigen, putative [Perkinsus marinus ATCC 50983]EER16824.1 RESA-H3 antigen, putative [Perkinsus marinus ATCC 50983]|eukprot:XP_002785028.1 RESA-H3 antigen, putative [Perkinsus marinus ATCC 50983]
MEIIIVPPEEHTDAGSVEADAALAPPEEEPSVLPSPMPESLAEETAISQDLEETTTPEQQPVEPPVVEVVPEEPSFPTHPALPPPSPPTRFGGTRIAKISIAERKQKANPVEPRVIDEDLLLAGIEDVDIISAMHKREEASVVEENPLFVGGENWSASPA